MKKLIISFSVALSFFILSCTGDDVNDPVVIGPLCNVVPVNADIDSPTVWKAGSVYVITDDLIVRNVLTIEAGAIIKISDARIEVVNGGKITANGTPENHITFTSLKDDSYCGDSNNNGTATTAQKGDWVSIYLHGGTNHMFKYCDILYAGKDGGGYRNAVVIASNALSFTFDHCTFAHTASGTGNSDFAFHGSNMNDNNVSVFTNNAFYNNDRPLYVNSNYSLDASNIFHNPANVAQKNTRNGIYIWDSTKNNTIVSWNITEVPYVVDAFNQGGFNNILNIGANVVVKFKGTTSGLVFQATRPVNVHPSAWLTSYYDDIHGGDTNGDGNGAIPAFGDWDGFFNSDPNVYVTAPNILYDNH